jgi:16S rRNA pseudouridine516 synthase
MSKLSLDRILQSQGYGTRKFCRTLIEDGEVTINGVVHDNYKETIETDGLVFRLFDEDVVYREHVYIALNKPPTTNVRASPATILAC